MKRHGRFLLALFMLLFGAMTLAGCGRKTTHINSALGKVKEYDYAAAQTELDAAADQNEDPQLLARAQGIAYLGQANFEAAIDSFFKVFTYSKGHVTNIELDTSYYLATAQSKAGKHEDAIQTYNAILGMKEKDPGTYYLRGCEYLELGYFDEAVKDFNTAVEYDKKNADLYIKIYEVLHEFGFDDQGKDYLDHANRQNIKLTDMQKGKLYFFRGEYEESRKYLEKARSNDDDGAIIYLGKTYEELGDTNYAASLYKTYLEKNTADAKVWNQLGTCQMKAKEYDDALQSFETGLECAGGSEAQALRFNQIVVYEYRGDFQKAAVLMKSYLESYPDDAAAKREYEFLKTR